jgi:hypothetical protein
MPVKYTKEGVQYDVAGLLSTARHMPEKEELKQGLIASFYKLTGPNLSEAAAWIVDHMTQLFRKADKEEQWLILKQVIDL